MSVAFGVVSLRGLATIQDGGRRGHMHEGVPPGGALVPELLARANCALGNAWNAPAIELFGTLALEARGAIGRFATDDGAVTVIAPGGRFDSAGARYVAIAGGVKSPLCLGGRGALVAAGIGGWLRVGDALVADAIETGDACALPAVDDDAPIRVVVGPDVSRFDDAAIETLLASDFAVSATRDRIGARLAGPRLARRDTDLARSMPMVRGAIQVPSSGEAIVLGPDHPTTGGYPILAVVIRADLGRFAARPSGTSVRFSAVSIDEARSAWREHRVRWAMT